MSSCSFSEESDYNYSSDYETTISSKSVCTESIANLINTTNETTQSDYSYTNEYYDTTCESNNINYKLPNIINPITDNNNNKNAAIVINNKDTDISEVYKDDNQNNLNSHKNDRRDNINCYLINGKYYLSVNETKKFNNVNGNIVFELDTEDLRNLRDYFNTLSKTFKTNVKIDEKDYKIEGSKLTYKYIYGKNKIKRYANLKTIKYKTFVSLPKTVLKDCLKWYNENNNNNEYNEKINIIKILLYK